MTVSRVAQVSREFAPEDPAISLRMVGSHEYINALQDLERLVAMSTEDEIAVFNDVIREQVEYSFFSGAAGANTNNGTDSFTDENRGLSQSAGNRKHALQWMMALARVELAASVSMYGHVGNAFSLMAPAQFGLQEYGLLVADDAGAHFQALNKDEKFRRRVRKGKKVDSDTVAYLRRLKVVSDMVAYVGNNGSPEYVAVAAEMVKPLKRARESLSQQAEIATLDMQYSSSSAEHTRQYGHTSYKDVISRSPITKACQRLFLERFGR